MAFIWNMSALCILPVSAINAKTTDSQLAAIYAAAIDPNTDPSRADQLMRLHTRLVNKIANK